MPEPLNFTDSAFLKQTYALSLGAHDLQSATVEPLRIWDRKRLVPHTAHHCRTGGRRGRQKINEKGKRSLAELFHCVVGGTDAAQTLYKTTDRRARRADHLISLRFSLRTYSFGSVCFFRLTTRLFTICKRIHSFIDHLLWGLATADDDCLVRRHQRLLFSSVASTVFLPYHCSVKLRHCSYKYKCKYLLTLLRLKAEQLDKTRKGLNM